MASKFNKFFVNFAKNLTEDIQESNNKFQDFLKNEKDPMKVSDLHDKINVNKETDIYGIPPKLVKSLFYRYYFG